jgi:hypothetical protein
MVITGEWRALRVVLNLGEASFSATRKNTFPFAFHVTPACFCPRRSVLIVFESTSRPITYQVAQLAVLTYKPGQHSATWIALIESKKIQSS